MTMDWEKDVCTQVDAICQTKTELERLQKIEELVTTLEELWQAAYLAGKNARETSEHIQTKLA